MKKNDLRKRIMSGLLAVAIGLCTICTGCGTNDQVGQNESEVTIDDNYRNYYEIFVGSYYDSNGDGIGDLNGISEKLDYISDLGCNGIWLTPMMEAPSYHKYDTTDYYTVDSSFGTNEDFEKLAASCHEKNIKIIIDLVINHSSSNHPWFTEACDYLRNLPEGSEPDPTVCPYVDYYHFSREQVNNTYREVSGSNWYYEAVFDFSQPDLNLENEQLVEELQNVAKFWIDLGVDGFRMDAVLHYDEADQAFNVSFLKEYYEYCKSIKPDFYMVSEAWAPKSTIASYYESMTPSFFNFDVADAEGKLIKTGRGTMNAEKFVNACLDYQLTYGSANGEFIDAPFITNHDMGRVANAVMSDVTTLKMTAGLLLSMNGSPFIYYGEEIGMKSKGKADENKRLHMNWSASDDEGICKDPSNADKDIEQSFPAVDEQINDEDSLLSFYKKALKIRNLNPEIARGTLSIVDELTDGDVAVVKKEWNGSVIYIAYNTSEEQADIDFSKADITNINVVGDMEAKAGSALMNGDVLNAPGKSIVILK